MSEDKNKINSILALCDEKIKEQKAAEDRMRQAVKEAEQLFNDQLNHIRIKYDILFKLAADGKPVEQFLTKI